MTVGAWQRWLLTDPALVLPNFRFPVNPNQMSPQQNPQVIEPASLQEDGGNSDRQTPAQPLQWQFQGTVFTLAQLDTFQTWLDYGLPVTLVDHWGYHFTVLLTSIETARAGKSRHHERHTYTVHALLLSQAPGRSLV